MADSKELVIASRFNFVQELLPSAQRTALLFHLSYLCVANFPKLEWLLRKCAVETQLLFGSSEALLVKCTDISTKLVSLLLPQLKLAVEKNENDLTVTSLELSREWIILIIDRVEDMVQRYGKQNLSVASCTSGVIAEKLKTDKKIKQTSQKIEALEKVVSDLEAELKKVTMEIGQMEGKPQLKSNGKDGSGKMNDLSIMAVLIPFVGDFVKSKTQAPSNESFKPLKDQSTLRNKKSTIQVKLTEMQMKMTSLKIECDNIPNPVLLNDVQTCLSQIQAILINLEKFWEWVGVLLEALKDKTLTFEHFIEDSELKESFMASIDSAQEHWKAFCELCLNAKGIFSWQTKDAYKFLETSPSSLSPEEWKRQYASVTEKLDKISHDYLVINMVLK